MRSPPLISIKTGSSSLISRPHAPASIQPFLPGALSSTQRGTRGQDLDARCPNHHWVSTSSLLSFHSIFLPQRECQIPESGYSVLFDWAQLSWNDVSIPSQFFPPSSAKTLTGHSFFSPLYCLQFGWRWFEFKFASICSQWIWYLFSFKYKDYRPSEVKATKDAAREVWFSGVTPTHFPGPL